MSTDTATTTPAIATGTYMIDPSHSEVGFVARHAMITKVRGAFRTFEGTGYFDQENPSNSHLKLDILADSIDTGNADRDGHLRGNDFFDMENHPRITFASTSIEAATAQMASKLFSHTAARTSATMPNTFSTRA